MATGPNPRNPARVRRGHLKYSVLEVIAVHARNGYEVIKELEARGGRPSAGSVYPVLAALVKDGSLRVNAVDGRNEYIITPRGKTLLVEYPRPHGAYDVDDVESFLAVKDANKKLTQVVREVSRAVGRAKRRKLMRILDACRSEVEALV